MGAVWLPATGPMARDADSRADNGHIQIAQVILRTRATDKSMRLQQPRIYQMTPIRKQSDLARPGDGREQNDHDAANRPVRHFAPADEALMLKAPQRMRKIVHTFNTLFADTGGVTLMSVETSPVLIRRRTAMLIREARRAGDIGRAVRLRDAWRERIAVCRFEGVLSTADSELVALNELIEVHRYERSGVNRVTMTTYSLTPMLPARFEQRDGRMVEVEPSRPAPMLLTADEAIRLLRLDDLANGECWLYQRRKEGLLAGVQVEVEAGRAILVRVPTVAQQLAERAKGADRG